MKILSIAILASLKLCLNAVSADDAFKKSLRSISHQDHHSRDLAMCGYWTKLGHTMKGSESLDFFGSAVTTSRYGDVIAVSAPSERNAGYIKVFSFDPTTETRQMLGNKIEPKNRGGEPIAVTSLSLSDNGRYLAVANVENKNPSGVELMSGGVSVYALNDTSDVWDQVGELEPIYGAAFQTTASVSLAGDGLSYVFSTSGSAVGVHAKTRVFYFDVHIGKWTPKGSPINEKSTGFVSDESSVSMSRDGNTIVIGSSRNSKKAKSVGEKEHGRVRVFTFVDGAWVQVGSDIYGSQGFSYFGKSVSLAQDNLTLAVGAEGTDFNTGVVKVFNYQDGDWVQIGSDILGPSRHSFFGSSVALSSSESGLFVATGAYGDDDSTGTAWVFQFIEGSSSWHQLGEVISDVGKSVFMGASVAMSQSGKTVVIGSPLSNYNGYSSGSAYVYELSEVTCSPTSSVTSQPSTTANAESSIFTSLGPSIFPSEALSVAPSDSTALSSSPAPSLSPSWSSAPTIQPSDKPSSSRSIKPTPSMQPSSLPTVLLSTTPSLSPSPSPTTVPSQIPSSKPSDTPSMSPSAQPSISPSRIPTLSPSLLPSLIPSEVYSAHPTSWPSDRPSRIPSVKSSTSSSTLPSAQPTSSLTVSSQPTESPSTHLTLLPTSTPSATQRPSSAPSKAALPTSTSILGVNAGTTTESVEISGNTHTTATSTCAFVTSVASAILLSFA
jgi:hypothetical protein